MFCPLTKFLSLGLFSSRTNLGSAVKDRCVKGRFTSQQTLKKRDYAGISRCDTGALKTEEIGKTIRETKREWQKRHKVEEEIRDVQSIRRN